MEHCDICNRSFKNKNSLNSHKSRFHKTVEKISKAVGGDTHAFRGDIEKTKKRYRSNAEFSEQSEDESEVSFKRSKGEESNDEIIPKLTRVVSGLVIDMENVSGKVDGLEKAMKQIPITFSKIAKDIDEAEDKIEENKQNINREKLFKEMSGSGIDLEMKKFYKKVME